MIDWSAVLTRPAGLREDTFDTWFDGVAEHLLNRSRLVAAGSPHRFTEIEFYYHCPEHPDAFAHRDPLQKECGRWYFHRTGGVLRGGSFKGLDLTFGDGTSHGGVLIRGLETAEGTLIDGPSLCVDRLLDCTGATSLAQLDRSVAGHDAWDEESTLILRPEPGEEPRPLQRSGRVGLTLKKAQPASHLPRYLCRTYRYLSEPRRIAKGKLYLVLALHAGGASPEAIRATTGCPMATVARYVADFEAGRLNADFGPFFGAELKPVDLCRIHGVWHAVHGAGVAQATH
jgi:hypothetical protein